MSFLLSSGQKVKLDSRNLKRIEGCPLLREVFEDLDNFCFSSEKVGKVFSLPKTVTKEGLNFYLQSKDDFEEASISLAALKALEIAYLVGNEKYLESWTFSLMRVNPDLTAWLNLVQPMISNIELLADLYSYTSVGHFNQIPSSILKRGDFIFNWFVHGYLTGRILSFDSKKGVKTKTWEDLFHSGSGKEKVSFFLQQLPSLVTKNKDFLKAYQKFYAQERKLNAFGHDLVPQILGLNLKRLTEKFKQNTYLVLGEYGKFIEAEGLCSRDEETGYPLLWFQLDFEVECMWQHAIEIRTKLKLNLTWTWMAIFQGGRLTYVTFFQEEDPNFPYYFYLSLNHPVRYEITYKKDQLYSKYFLTEKKLNKNLIEKLSQGPDINSSFLDWLSDLALFQAPSSVEMTATNKKFLTEREIENSSFSLKGTYHLSQGERRLERAPEFIHRLEDESQSLTWNLNDQIRFEFDHSISETQNDSLDISKVKEIRHNGKRLNSGQELISETKETSYYLSGGKDKVFNQCLTIVKDIEQLVFETSRCSYTFQGNSLVNKIYHLQNHEVKLNFERGSTFLYHSDETFKNGLLVPFDGVEGADYEISHFGDNYYQYELSRYKDSFRLRSEEVTYLKSQPSFRLRYEWFPSGRLARLTSWEDYKLLYEEVYDQEGKLIELRDKFKLALIRCSDQLVYRCPLVPLEEAISNNQGEIYRFPQADLIV